MLCWESVKGKSLLSYLSQVLLALVLAQEAYLHCTWIVVRSKQQKQTF